MIDVNLTGAWNTVQPAAHRLLTQGEGGAMVLTASVAGIKGLPNLAHYSAAKHGVVGIMRSLSNELGPAGIRVNALLPTTVDTPMVQNDALRGMWFPDRDTPPTVEEFTELAYTLQALPIPWVESIDVSNAVLFLVSDDARYITGETLRIDGGSASR
jgi:NAD(P)-dependent dehydrogenase (short-subunit alcohol dehydrogenase family)